MRAIKPDGKGDVTATHIAWESRDTVSMMPSFLYTDGLLFCVKETGIAVCLDAANGKLLWRERLGGAYSASPVLASVTSAAPPPTSATSGPRRRTWPPSRTGRRTACGPPSATAS